MARKTVNIQPPLAGLDRAWAVQSAPPFTLADALNVRCRSPFDDRAILSSRPGLTKAFAQNVSMQAATESFTKDFQATKDCYLYSGDPTQNNAGASTCFCGWFSTLAFRPIIHFDLTTIPGGATVTAASLAIRQWRTYFDAGGSDVGKIRRLTQSAWVNFEATWNIFSTGNAWSPANVVGANPTGPFSTTDEVNFTFYSSITPAITVISGLGPLVQDALTRVPLKQLHLMLMRFTESGITNTIQFDSLEAGIVANRPKLTVTYEVAV